MLRWRRSFENRCPWRCIRAASRRGLGYIQVLRTVVPATVVVFSPHANVVSVFCRVVLPAAGKRLLIFSLCLGPHEPNILSLPCERPVCASPLLLASNTVRGQAVEKHHIFGGRYRALCTSKRLETKPVETCILLLNSVLYLTVLLPMRRTHVHVVRRTLPRQLQGRETAVADAQKCATGIGCWFRARSPLCGTFPFWSETRNGNNRGSNRLHGQQT